MTARSEMSNGDFSTGNVSKRLKQEKRLAAQYIRDYIKPNVLFQFWKVMVNLEKDFIVFDKIYSNLKFSSYVCSLFWLKVSRIKLLHSLSLSFKCDSEESLFPLNEKVLEREYAAVKICRTLVTKTISELLDFLNWNKSLRWERRHITDKILTIYEGSWTEISDWEKTLQELADENQGLYLKETLETHRDKAVKELLSLHNRMNTLKVDTVLIKKLNKQCTNCIKLNVFMQYSEAQILSAYIFMVSDLDKFHLEYEAKTNKDAQQIIENSIQTLKESKHKGAVLKENKYAFQTRRINSLGPFGFLQVPSTVLSAISIDTEFNIWKLNRDICGVIPGFKVLLDGVTGMVTSKVSPIHYSVKQLEAMGLPGMIDQWVYLPPMSRKNGVKFDEMIQFGKNDSPLHLLVLKGGFGFFDGAMKLVSVCALVDGVDMFFNFPLYDNLTIRQYKIKYESQLNYGIFTADERLFALQHESAFVTPEHWTPTQDEEDERNIEKKWAFIFKDNIEEDAHWPHYAFEMASLPEVLLRLRTKAYKPSPNVKALKKVIDNVREFWPQDFPPLVYKQNKAKRKSKQSRPNSYSKFNFSAVGMTRSRKF